MDSGTPLRREKTTAHTMREAFRYPRFQQSTAGYFVCGFQVAPLSPMSVYVFASVMGLLWLSAVPATKAAVAQIFGVAHLSMPGGFVFLSHPIGSFLDVWMGALMYDLTGNCDMAWLVAIVPGVLAALINPPVNESAINRSAQAMG